MGKCFEISKNIHSGKENLEKEKLEKHMNNTWKNIWKNTWKNIFSLHIFCQLIAGKGGWMGKTCCKNRRKNRIEAKKRRGPTCQETQIFIKSSGWFGEHMFSLFFDWFYTIFAKIHIFEHLIMLVNLSFVNGKWAMKPQMVFLSRTFFCPSPLFEKTFREEKTPTSSLSPKPVIRISNNSSDTSNIGSQPLDRWKPHIIIILW